MVSLNWEHGRSRRCRYRRCGRRFGRRRQRRIPGGGQGDGGGNGLDLAAALNGIVDGLGNIPQRLNALKLQAEHDPLDLAGTPPVGGPGAPATTGMANAVGNAGLERALANCIAKAVRESRSRRRSESSSDDDDDSRSPALAFTDQRARRCDTRGEPLVYF